MDKFDPKRYWTACAAAGVYRYYDNRGAVLYVARPIS